MTPAAAVAITALAAIAYTAASVWAARRQAKWMAEMEQKFKNGNPMNCTRHTFAANKSVITAESAANGTNEVRA